MSFVERTAEGVARGFDRRRFLGRVGGTVFAVASAFAVEGVLAPKALATGPCPNNQDICNCRPPGTYCLSGECVGTGCNSNVGCYVWTGGYPDTCWCSKECCHNCGNLHTAYCGYYTCCDCICGGTRTCGCRVFNYTCRPTANSKAGTARPDAPACC
jgi:hypothetical protein